MPLAVRDWYAKQIASQPAPLALSVDAEWRILDWYGFPSSYRLKLEKGRDARDQLPMLYGMEIEASSRLEYVGLPTGPVVDLVWEASGEGGFLLLRDARERHDAVQLTQQDRNEIELLRRELNMALAEAHRANTAKSRFIAAMSHEFRTPLTAIQGYSERLAAQQNADTEEAASAIHRASDYLLTLVENLIDQGRLNTSEIVLQNRPCALRELEKLLQEIFQPLCAQRGLGLQVQATEELPAWVALDETRLRQIAVNLLGNACKFTDRGEVRVELGYSAGQLQLQVSDTGPGIAPENQDRIFGAFERVDETAPGAGLGLNISRQIAERMGGRLRLQSVLGEGSTFSLFLPAPKCAAPDQSGADGRGLQVVLAEDDSSIAALLKLILKDAGHRVKHFPDGATAAAFFESGTADCLITDMRLPGLGGVELIARVRQVQPDCRIVTLTASANATDREQALAAGADLYLSKPVPPDQLIAALVEKGS